MDKQTIEELFNELPTQEIKDVAYLITVIFIVMEKSKREPLKDKVSEVLKDVSIEDMLEILFDLLVKGMDRKEKHIAWFAEKYIEYFVSLGVVDEVTMTYIPKKKRSKDSGSDNKLFQS